MNFRFTRPSAFSLICLLLLSSAAHATGVSDDDFKALKDLVTQQGKRLDQLEQAHERDQKTLDQNQKIHEQDQQEIERLKQQLQDTQKTATDAQQKADAASQVQPVHPVPPAPPATHNFTMVGDAEVQFGKVDGSHSAFALADFAPIFLFRAHDNILFEAGLDITLQNTSTPTSPTTSHDSGSTTSVDLSFATLDYLFSDYSTFVGGLMLLPLGTYSERSAGWLNKIPDDPLPRDLVPGNGVGIQFRGAFPVGAPGEAITYSIYGANGPSSSDGTANHDQLDLGGNVGIKSNGTTGNLHGSPAVGGRLGWFKPWKAHYDLELGISGQTGPWDDAGDHQWSAGVLDAALHLGSNIEVKGEYIHTWLDTSDEGTLHPRGWWVQASYRLAGLNLDLPFLSNIDLVGRYDAKRDSSTKIDTDRYTVGYVYYFSNTLLFEGDYEFHHSNDPEENHNVLVFQLSYGF
jgi:hypothetical protein